MKWPTPVILAVVGVVAATVVWHTSLSPHARSLRYRSETMQAFRSSDSGARKQAAWRLIERPDPLLEAFVVGGVLGSESDPDVREAYVYTLGRLGDGRNFPAIETTLDADPSGYVRAAAWLAAARCDPERYRTLVATRRPPTNPWDRIGVAQAQLSLGRTQAVDELLRETLGEDPSRCRVASRALHRWLRPLLDAAGRWPLNADVHEGEAWPREFACEIARRCAVLDLQAIADDHRQFYEPAYRAHRNVARVTGFRDRLASLLFAD